MRAELIAFETQDFGQTGLHKAERVLRVGTDAETGEAVVMCLSDQQPNLFYFKETVHWIAGNIMWSMSVDEYNAITQATDRLIGNGRANAQIIAETGGPPDIEGIPGGG